MPDMRGRYVRTPEIRAKIGAASRGTNYALQAQRQAQVLNALPGTLNEISERTGLHYNTVKRHLAVLRALRVVAYRHVSNSKGFGYANQYYETEIKEGT